uniref:Peptidase_M14 domain-containing protein n=1 Tax=Angiostrongylus cantonensis TaxID=6313 RepID=A0A158P615_ANGCA
MPTVLRGNRGDNDMIRVNLGLFLSLEWQLNQLMKPEIKYIGNIHGNEPLGRELLIRLADYLCEAFNEKDKEVLQLLNSTSIHILPTMNPDGFNIALNTVILVKNSLDFINPRIIARCCFFRDFPELDEVFYELEKLRVPRFDHLMDLFVDDKERQPETVAVGRWTLSLPFVLSASLHEGDLVANYPFDSAVEEGVSAYSASPDDGTFRWLAQTYAANHAHMAKNDHPPCDGTSEDAFARQGGITNGAKWYSVSGGMQDFNYLATNAMEITLELSCEKMPEGKLLPQFWNDNKKALMEYMFAVHSGIKGLITDAVTGEPISEAVVWIRNGTDPMPIRHPVTSWLLGDYYRILPAGQYEVIVNAEGYKPAARNVTVTNKVRDSAMIVDFVLEPIAQEQPTDVEIAQLVDALRQQQE